MLRFKFSPKKTKYLIDDKINRIISKLQSSKRPLIHLGHGVSAFKRKEALKFFNKFKIPFVLTWNADDLISSNHSMYFGRPGAFYERGSNYSPNCDFYLSIGTRLPYMVTGYNSKNFASRAKFKCMVDIDKFELNKKDINLNLKINVMQNIFFKNFLKK